MRFLIFLTIAMHLASYGFAQKTVIDTTAIGKWTSVEYPVLSNDGKYVSYQINNDPVHQATLVVESVDHQWKKMFPYIDKEVFTRDSKRLIFSLPGDSLCILSLGVNKRQFIAHISGYQLLSEGKKELLVYRRKDVPGKFIIRNLKTGKEQSYSGVQDYLMNKQGTVLLVRKEDTLSSPKMQRLQWIDLENGKIHDIWKGEKAAGYTFDNSGAQLIFIAETNKQNSLWHYTAAMDQAQLLADDHSPGVDTDLFIAGDKPEFSKDGTRILFQLTEHIPLKALVDAVKVNIWSYKEELPITQMDNDKHLQARSYAAVIDLAARRVIRLQQEKEWMLPRKNDEFVVVVSSDEHDFDVTYYRPPYHEVSVYLTSTRDGHSKRVKENVLWNPYYTFSFSSPNGKWLVYYDAEQKAYCSYDPLSGITRNITGSIPVSLIDETYFPTRLNPSLNPKIAFMHYNPHLVGVAGWLEEDQAILIYDNYDIWQVDPSGLKLPVNITNGYGQRNHIRLRLNQLNSMLDEVVVSPHASLLLTAFNTDNKNDGFCRKTIDKVGDPELLSSGPYYMYGTTGFLENMVYEPWIKAQNASVWLVKRQSAVEAPNYYLTRDFKRFDAVSHLAPHKDYNWLNAELIHWQKTDGQGTGILYKPENFDPEKKYPVIFDYYEHRSDALYGYLKPDVCHGPIDIPWFVSRGYIVCVPDITHQLGEPGESALNEVVSAANYLSEMPWVDKKHLGITGHSFGGYETNYIVSHSSMFAAAVEAAGMSDIISSYGGLWANVFADHFLYENGICRMGVTLWERPDLYIKNSPVFNAEGVTTPLLMMHNRRDDRVPFSQAIEFFTGLRRLNKKVWLLEYDNGFHNVQDKDAVDYTTRLTQFFDHYLKDAPAPKWMTSGVPSRLKGIETGLELDLRAGVTP